MLIRVPGFWWVENLGNHVRKKTAIYQLAMLGNLQVTKSRYYVNFILSYIYINFINCVCLRNKMSELDLKNK